MKNKIKSIIGIAIFGILLTGCDLGTSDTDNTITSISFNVDSYTLEKDETLQLTVFDNFNNEVDNSLYLIQSSDSSVATVTEEGLVTAIEEGEATITAMLTSNLGISTTCTITVEGETEGEESTTDPEEPDEEEDSVVPRCDIDALMTYQDLNELTSYSGIPGTTVEGQDANNVLVIPIEFTDYTFESEYGLDSEQVVQRLDLLFNGDGPEETGYWESVSSYFYKSSFGRLNLNFEVGDVVTASMTASQLVETSSTYDYDKNFTIMQDAIDEYYDNGMDFNQFDNDDNDEIDAVWFIYSAHNYSNNYALYDNEQTFWAYVYYDYYNQIETDSSQPDFNKFGWASFDFLYEGYNAAGRGLDTHTFIHETGHLLGLEDYYDSTIDYSNYTYECSPLGRYDMQDNNIGDHNAWTKAALGWVDPLVYDTSEVEEEEVTITISKDTPLFLTNDYQGYVFDEYIIFEFYSPNDLNELDSEVRYYSNLDTMPNTNGVKVLHVDARLINGWNGNIVDPINYSRMSWLTMGASNTLYYSYTDFRLISMISSKTTGGDFLYDYVAWDEDDLFEENDVFNLYDYRVGNTSNDRGALNDGTALNVDVKIDEVGEDYATLTIKKL